MSVARTCSREEEITREKPAGVRSSASEKDRRPGEGVEVGELSRGELPPPLEVGGGENRMIAPREKERGVIIGQSDGNSSFLTRIL